MRILRSFNEAANHLSLVTVSDHFDVEHLHSVCNFTFFHIQFLCCQSALKEDSRTLSDKNLYL